MKLNKKQKAAIGQFAQALRLDSGQRDVLVSENTIMWDGPFEWAVNVSLGGHIYDSEGYGPIAPSPRLDAARKAVESAGLFSEPYDSSSRLNFWHA